MTRESKEEGKAIYLLDISPIASRIGVQCHVFVSEGVWNWYVEPFADYSAGRLSLPLQQLRGLIETAYEAAKKSPGAPARFDHQRESVHNLVATSQELKAVPGIWRDELVQIKILFSDEDENGFTLPEDDAE